MRIKLLCLIASSFFALFASEFALRVFGFESEPGQIKFTRAPYAQFDVRTDEFQYVQKANAQGLRYRDIPIENTDGATRVFVVGDSFVEGVGVQREQMFTSLLEERFAMQQNPVHFINGGIGNQGPLRYAQRYVHVGLKYNPDVLLLCLFANDVMDTLPTDSIRQIVSNRSFDASVFRKQVFRFFPHWYSLLSRLKHNLKAQVGAGSFTSRPFDSWLRDVAVEKGRSSREFDEWINGRNPDLREKIIAKQINPIVAATGFLRPSVWNESFSLSSADARARFQQMKEILAEVVDLSRKKNVEVGFVYIPINLEYDPASHASNSLFYKLGYTLDKQWLSGESILHNQLAELSESLGVQFLNMTPMFRAALERGNQFNYPIDGHWNPAGHRLAAATLYDWLVSSSLLKR